MKKKNPSGILALIFGTILWAITAIFLSTDSKGNTKKGVKENVYKAKKKAKELDKKKVMEKAEKAITRAVSEYKSAKKKVDGHIKKAKTTLGKIDKAKYETIVKDVVAEVKKNSKTTTKGLADLKALLVDDYKKVSPKKKKKA